LISAVLGIPLGEGDEEGSPFAGIFGDQGADGVNPAMAAALGPLGALIQGQFTALIDQISKTVREVHLTVYFKDGTQTESVDLVTHVVSTGKGSERSDPRAAATGSAPDPWVNALTGVPIVGEPVPCRTGSGLCDPANPNQRVIRYLEWLQGGGRPLGIPPGPGGGPGGGPIPSPGGINK
jgi:general secretion pathway protein I